MLLACMRERNVPLVPQLAHFACQKVSLYSSALYLLSWPHLPSAGIAGVHHNAWLSSTFIMLSLPVTATGFCHSWFQSPYSDLHFLSFHLTSLGHQHQHQQCDSFISSTVYFYHLSTVLHFPGVSFLSCLSSIKWLSYLTLYIILL
jgi:hypothetical protein